MVNFNRTSISEKPIIGRFFCTTLQLGLLFFIHPVLSSAEESGFHTVAQQIQLAPSTSDAPQSEKHSHAIAASEGITLEQVIMNVLEHNPQLRMNSYEANAAATRIRQAEQGKPFEMTLDVQDFAGSGTYNGINRVETTLSLGKVLELGGKANSRGNLARQQASLLKNKQDSKRMDLLAMAAGYFMNVVIDQHRLRITQEQLTLVKRTHDIVEQRVKAGRSHVAELRRAKITLTRAEIELEHAVHRLASSRLKLATAWGETKPKFSSARAELFVLPEVQAFDQLESLLENNPDLIRFATEKRVAEAQLRLAQARQTSDLKLSGGIRYFNEKKDGALVLSVSMPFGSASRAKPYVEEMRHLTQREPLRHEQQRLALHSSLYEIYQELLHAQSAFKALNQKMIPEAEHAVSDYEQGYKSGRFSLLELNETQRILLDARLESVVVAANYHRFRIEIERLTGATLRSGVNP